MTAHTFRSDETKTSGHCVRIIADCLIIQFKTVGIFLKYCMDEIERPTVIIQLS